MDADLGRGVGHRKAGDSGVFFEAAPVALVAEGFTLEDANRSEESPAADESGLAGREAAILDGEEFVVMEDVAMNHENASVLLTRLYTGAVVTRERGEQTCPKGYTPVFL